MGVTRYVRQHHVGLIAVFLALTGTAYAGSQVAQHSTKPNALKTKGKKGPRGPAGAPGPQKIAGPAGSSAASSVFAGIFGVTAGANTTGPASGVDTAGNGFNVTPGATLTARDLAVVISPIPLPTDGPVTLALRVGGLETALTCTVPTGGTTCSDSTHTVSVPPGSKIDFGVHDASSSDVAVHLGWRAVG